MARVEAKCLCTVEDCTCPEKDVQWVDAISHYCRDCESQHQEGLSERWGPKGRKAY